MSLANPKSPSFPIFPEDMNRFSCLMFLCRISFSWRYSRAMQTSKYIFIFSQRVTWLLLTILLKSPSAQNLVMVMCQFCPLIYIYSFSSGSRTLSCLINFNIFSSFSMCLWSLGRRLTHLTTTQSLLFLCAFQVILKPCILRGLWRT